MNRIYAKSADKDGYKEPLAEHTIHDIMVGRRLVENLPFSRKKRQQIGYDLDECLMFHDLGKAAVGFQKSLDNGVKWGRRHEVISGVIATGNGRKNNVVFPVLTHHKTIPPAPGDDEKRSSYLNRFELPYENHINEVWDDMANEWSENIDAVRYEVGLICKEVGRENILQNPLNVNALLTEDMIHLLSRTDQAKYFKFKQRENISLLRGLVISADHITSAGNDMPIRIPRFSDYHNTIEPQTPYGYQARASKHVGNLILRSPTGSGKTQAALMWALKNQEHNSRLFYTLPTTASINAMYLRLQNKFNGNKDKKIVGLLHSRIASSIYSMLEEDDSYKKQDRAWLLSSLAKEMYFPIRVCTPHQILRFTLFGKGWELMLSEFPHSCLIFDEIHAAKPKHIGLIMATAKYIISKGGRVMFLSATLPNFLRRIIEKEIGDIDFIQPHRNSKSDRGILEKRRHILEVRDGTILDNIDLIVKESEKTKSTLVVCNHVPTAQLIYRQLKAKVNDTVLLHSQFARRDRNYVENELQRSKAINGTYKQLPRILVATQVVEVSLDLDFQQCFTEPAAIDALVQRFGRVNRYSSRPPAKIVIFRNQYSKDEKVYSQKLRDKSLKALGPLLHKTLIEEQVNEAADKVYGKGYDSYMKTEYNEGFGCVNVKKMVAGVNQDWLEYIIEKAEGSVEVLPYTLEGKFNEYKDQKLFIEAYNLTVPLGKWRLNVVMKDLNTSQDLWRLHNCRYTSDVGLEYDKGEGYEDM
jgi:CRISPR-associated endonuclease/helicase Cas3